MDAYLEQAAPFARPILGHLRSLVHDACPEATESIRWGMPAFLVGSRNHFMMSAFQHHCAFLFWHPEMKARLQADDRLRSGAMGQFGRITSLEDLPGDEAMRTYLRFAVGLEKVVSATERRRAKSGPRLVRLPEELSRSLQENTEAARTFELLPPGCRREYAEWISEAKRPETRERRLKATIERLAAGKRLHGSPETKTRLKTKGRPD